LAPIRKFWVAALLASTLALDLMFRSDFEDGTLEQLLLSHHPVILLVIAKITAHWLLTGAPIIVAGIFLGIILNLQENSFIPLLLTLLLGTPVLSLVGSAATALTIGLRSSGMLLALLILPLYVPVLIFAVAAVNNAAQGLSIQGELFFLSAILVLSATLAPFATAASLRIRLG
jgi:heme exporter protein B